MRAKAITPTDEFYVVTKNVVDPDLTQDVAAGRWQLTVEGIGVRTYALTDLEGRAGSPEGVATPEGGGNQGRGELIRTGRGGGDPLSDAPWGRGVATGAGLVAVTG